MANDRSFYTVGELAELIRGRVIGDPDLKIKGIAGVAESKEEDLTFAEDKNIWLRQRNPGLLLLLCRKISVRAGRPL